MIQEFSPAMGNPYYTVGCSGTTPAFASQAEKEVKDMTLLNSPLPRSVLLVEDDEATREVVALLLANEGCQVATASNGRVALEQLRHGARPQLIILDLMMPVMDGWQFRAEQRRDASLANIPVVVLSAAGDIRRKAGFLDAVEYLDKPVDPVVLLDTVRRLCA
jgi:CheY-like chemotaxis protein